MCVCGGGPTCMYPGQRPWCHPVWWTSEIPFNVTYKALWVLVVPHPPLQEIICSSHTLYHPLAFAHSVWKYTIHFPVSHPSLYDQHHSLLRFQFVILSFIHSTNIS